MDQARNLAYGKFKGHYCLGHLIVSLTFTSPSPAQGKVKAE